MVNGWLDTVKDTTATATAVSIYYADIPTDQTAAGPVKFTFYWTAVSRWEGTDYGVDLT
jgi:hypothetical protein